MHQTGYQVYYIYTVIFIEHLCYIICNVNMTVCICAYDFDRLFPLHTYYNIQSYWIFLNRSSFSRPPLHTTSVFYFFFNGDENEERLFNLDRDIIGSKIRNLLWNINENYYLTVCHGFFPSLAICTYLPSDNNLKRKLTSFIFRTWLKYNLFL